MGSDVTKVKLLLRLKEVCTVIPNAPPISAPLVGIFTLTIPQSDPFGLQTTANFRYLFTYLL